MLHAAARCTYSVAWRHAAVSDASADSLTTRTGTAGRVRWDFDRELSDIAADLRALDDSATDGHSRPKPQVIDVEYYADLARIFRERNQPLEAPEDCVDEAAFHEGEDIGGVIHHKYIPSYVLLDQDQYAFHVRTPTPPNDSTPERARVHVHAPVCAIGYVHPGVCVYMCVRGDLATSRRRRCRGSLFWPR